MMRLSTPGNARFTQAAHLNILYAGSEANVAASLSLFGLKTAHVTRFPDNDFGTAATQSLKKLGVDTSHILYGPQRMGLYFLENGSMQRSSRIVYDRFDSAFAHITPGTVDWNEVFKDASWFHWTGITPAISQGAADVCLEALQVAKKKGLTVSGDINYRRNLWQYGKTALDVMPALIEHTHIVVAGVADMENCANISGDSFEDTCKKFMKRFSNVKKMTTTLRNPISSSHNKLSALLWNGKELLHAKEYDLTHIVDRVGSGDAYMAGLIYGFDDWANRSSASIGVCPWQRVHGNIRWKET